MTEKNKPKAPGDQVSELTAGRLSVYLRCLNTLDGAGVKTISSKALAEQFHLNAAQIRKDLAYFGEFGVRGVGYYVKELKRHLRMILGLDRTVRVAILGAGNLGLALADYPGFRQEGFAIVALFDTERSKIGRRSRAGVRILDINEFRKIVKKDHIDIAVVAVPADSAQNVVNTAVQAGSGDSELLARLAEGAAGVKLKNVDLTVSMGEPVVFLLAREEAGVLKRRSSRHRLSHVDARGRVEDGATVGQSGNRPRSGGVGRGAHRMRRHVAPSHPQGRQGAIRSRRRGSPASWPPSAPRRSCALPSAMPLTHARRRADAGLARGTRSSAAPPRSDAPGRDGSARRGGGRALTLTIRSKP